MTIVVGVDGSESARHALRWAVREARDHGDTVKAVTAWHWDHPQVLAGSALTDERDRAEAMLAHEADCLPSYISAGVTVALEVIEGRPADVLIDASHNADLLVLGSHGHSHALHRVLGSVAADCIRGATCPVVVLPIHFPAQSTVASRSLPVRAPVTPPATSSPEVNP